MKVLVVSDVHALGLMEVRPELAFNTEYSDYRNRSLLSPDYGIMYIAANLKASGYEFEVVNLVADVHGRAGEYQEPEGVNGLSTGSPVSKPEAVKSSRENLFKTIGAFNPDVILMSISMYSFALYFRKLAGDIKTRSPGSILVAGGIYATFHPVEILEDGFVDVVVRGEGEKAAVAVLNSIESGKPLGEIQGISYRLEESLYHTPDVIPAGGLDIYPQLYEVAAEFKVKERIRILSALEADDDYLAGRGFLTSRGCPEACTFCLDPSLNKGKVRFHSPGFVKRAVDYCVSNFFNGPGTFFFGDAAFTANRKRLFRILDLISEMPLEFNIQTRADYLSEDVVQRLAGAGVKAVAIGAESFNNRILREVAGKRLDAETVIEAARTVKDNGINTLLTFIVGFPGESRASIERTVDLLDKLKLGTATFFPLVVFRGTPLFDLFMAGTSENDRKKARMNPFSEEFYFTSDEFPTPGELISFTREVNEAITIIPQLRPTS